MEAAPLVNYMVNVTNSGEMDADDVVLGFLVPPNAGKDGVPLQTLFGFERVHVKAGAYKATSARARHTAEQLTDSSVDNPPLGVLGILRAFRFWCGRRRDSPGQSLP